MTDNQLAPAFVAVEPGHEGHRLDYVDLALSLDASLSGRRIWACSPEGVAAAKSQRRSLGSDQWAVPCLREQATFWNRFRDVWTVGRLGPTQTCFTNVDEYLIALCVRSLTHSMVGVRGIVMRPPGRHKRSAWKAATIAWLEWRGAVLKHLESPFSDPDRGGADGSIVYDPSGLPGLPTVETQSAAPDERFRQRLGAWAGSDPRPVVAVVGALTDRKNVPSVLDLANGGGWRVLLVGRTHPDLPWLEKLPREDVCFTHFERVSDEDLRYTIEVATCLALLYSNGTGSSGILAHAITSATPIVAFGNDTVVSAAKQHGIGVVARSLDAVDLLAACDLAATTSVPQNLGENLFDAVISSWRRLLDSPEVGS